MEAEEAAAKRLEELGYTIFYRNLHIKYKHNPLCEFDIVLANCIVEVKSGKYIYTSHRGGFDTVVLQGHLPKHMTFYVYCVVKTDEEIAELNEDNYNNNIVFINRLEDIAIRHPPDNRECIINTQGILGHLMNRQLSTILKFNKIYISSKAYNAIYMQYNYVRDSYSVEENIMWSAKLRLLIDTGRLIITDTPPTTAYKLKRGPQETIYNSRIKINKRQPISIRIYHNLTAMPRVNDMEDLYIQCYDLRTNTEV
jgi:hypothetical protein